ncbi:MAG: glycosyltransferase family 39 protein [Sulfolobales archaeon]
MLTSTLPSIAVLVIIAFHFYYVYNYALRVNDYISDECWYVSSARNLIVKVFKGQPLYVSDDGLLGINVLVSSYLGTEGVINEILASGRVVKQDYRNVNMIYAEVRELDIIQRLSGMPNVISVIPGYRYPDSSRITDYLNTEHPPLVKYFIATSIAVCGDRPICWRLPSIIASCAILMIVYLIIKSVVGGTVGNYLGVVAVLITSLDTLFRSLSIVAMLDIFTSLFTVLTLYLIVKQRVYAAVAVLGLAFISKYTGLFALPALTYYMFKRMEPFKAILYVVCIPALMLILSSTPLISTLGFQQWWYEAVENAVRWHLSVKTLSGPPTSAPWEWLVGLNPFILHYEYVNGELVADLIARGNNAIYLIATALTLLILPALRKLPDGGITLTYTWSIFMMYVFIWIIGSRTQYSFYMVQLTPLIYTSLMIQLFWITFDKNFKELMRIWYDMLLNIIKWLRGEVRIKVRVIVE